MLIYCSYECAVQYLEYYEIIQAQIYMNHKNSRTFFLIILFWTLLETYKLILNIFIYQYNINCKITMGACMAPPPKPTASKATEKDRKMPETSTKYS